MIARLILCVATIALIASGADAQVTNSSPPSGLRFGPSATANGPADASVTATIEYIHRLGAEALARKAAPAGQKECPMPVHRPDTAKLEKMGVARPSPTIVYSMSTTHLNCPNPLDREK